MVTALSGCAGLREVHRRRIACRQQVHRFAAAIESLSAPGMRGSPAPVVLAGLFPGRGNSTLEALLPAVSEGCTGLYVAVRRIGGADGPAHVHIADSVVAVDVTQARLGRSDGVWRCSW